MVDIHVIQPTEMGPQFVFDEVTKKWNITEEALAAGGGGSTAPNVIDYNPTDHATVDDVVVENASDAVGWNGTELSVNGTPDTVVINTGGSNPTKEVEYVAIKIPIQTSGSFEIDLSQLNGSMMQIHASGVEQTLEQLIANYLLTDSNPYNFTSISATHEALGLVSKTAEFGFSANAVLNTSLVKKVEFLTYLQAAVLDGEDLSSYPPEELEEIELTYANVRMLSITDADTGDNRLFAPMSIVEYPYIYFTLVANCNDSETPVTTLNPNAKLLLNFDGIGSVSYDLPENAKDGDYLKVLSDVKLLGTDLVNGDYFQVYDGKSKVIPYRQDEFYSKLLGSVVIPPVTTESVIPLIDLGIVDVLPDYAKNGQRVIHRYYHSHSGQYRFITYYWYDSRGWVSDFDIKSSDDVKEGFLNQYLTPERFDININDRWKTTGIQYGNDKFPTASAVHGYVNYALSSKVDISEYNQTKNLAQANQLNLSTKVEQVDFDSVSATVTAQAQTLLNKADIAALTTLAQLVDTKADQAYVVSEIARITGNAPAALDTLAEIAAQLGNDQTQIDNLLTQIGNRVRFDAAQGLTALQQENARTNIGAEAAGAASAVNDALQPQLNTLTLTTNSHTISIATKADQATVDAAFVAVNNAIDIGLAAANQAINTKASQTDLDALATKQYVDESGFRMEVIDFNPEDYKPLPPIVPLEYMVTPFSSFVDNALNVNPDNIYDLTGTGFVPSVSGSRAALMNYVDTSKGAVFEVSASEPEFLYEFLQIAFIPADADPEVFWTSLLWTGDNINYSYVYVDGFRSSATAGAVSFAYKETGMSSYNSVDHTAFDDSYRLELVDGVVSLYAKDVTSAEFVKIDGRDVSTYNIGKATVLRNKYNITPSNPTGNVLKATRTISVVQPVQAAAGGVYAPEEPLVLPDSIEDGTYLKFTADANFLGMDVKTGDYVQLYEDRTKGILNRNGKLFTDLIATKADAAYVDAGLASKSSTAELDDVRMLAETNQLNVSTKAEQADLDAANATVAEHTQTLLTKADVAALTTLSQLVDTKADQAYVISEIARITGNAPAALDTLAEIAEQLGNDQTQINNLLTQIGNRVRFDAAQALTAPQQTQARDNINAEAKGVAANLVSNVTVASIGAATAAQGAKANTALQSADVAPVAFTGSYSDLINLPIISGTQEIYVQSNQPISTGRPYMWIQTGLPGQGVTLWVDNGE